MFADPFNTIGLIIDPSIHDGFKFEVNDIHGGRGISPSCPEDMYDLLVLIGSPENYIIKNAYNRGGDTPVAMSAREKVILASYAVLGPSVHTGSSVGRCRGWRARSARCPSLVWLDSRLTTSYSESPPSEQNRKDCAMNRSSPIVFNGFGRIGRLVSRLAARFTATAKQLRHAVNPVLASDDGNPLKHRALSPPPSRRSPCPSSFWAVHASKPHVGMKSGGVRVL